MIDRKQILKVIENDLLAAGLDPEKYLVEKYCELCIHLYETGDSFYLNGKETRWMGCKPGGFTRLIRLGKCICGAFEAK